MSRPRIKHPQISAFRPSKIRASRVVALLASVLVLPALLFAPSSVGAAVPPVGLGTAASFAVLAGAGITNTGPTTINGDVGTFATTSETGFGTVTLTGADHGGDAVTQQAKTDLTTAYNQAAGSGPPTNVAVELGGTTLTPGVYNGTTLQITGTLTLNTLGDPNAVFIFQSGSTLVTATASNVIVLGGATACNVYWQVASSATLGSTSHLVGTVMASTSISADTGATIQGRLLASTGAVTLDSNTISTPICAPPVTTTTTSPTSTSAGTGATGAGGPNGGSSNSNGTGSGSPAGPNGPPDSGFPPQLAFSGSSNRYAAGGIALLGLGVGALSVSRRRLAGAGRTSG